MRKTKIELKGNITFIKDKQSITKELKGIGNALMPSFRGRMNGALVNNQLLIIQMQSEGIHFNKTFHYKNYKERSRIIEDFQAVNSHKVCQYIENHFDVGEVYFEPILEITYDVDYCELPIQEAQNDLTNTELREVMSELKNYRPTAHIHKKKERKNVFFE